MWPVLEAHKSSDCAILGLEFHQGYVDDSSTFEGYFHQ